MDCVCRHHKALRRSVLTLFLNVQQEDLPQITDGILHSDNVESSSYNHMACAKDVNVCMKMMLVSFFDCF